MISDMQKVQDHGGSTIDSASHSGSSDLNGLENNATDTLGQAIMQHERDARRLRQALDADARPLLKTRPRQRPGITELIEREERAAALAAAAANGAVHTRGGSSGSSGSEPPLNVPREWGTRAKSQRGWMKKIREPSVVSVQLSPEPPQRAGLKGEEDAVIPRRTVLTGDEYCSPPRRDKAFPSDETPPSMNRSRPLSHPNALRPANSTLRNILDGEDADLGELSLLQSTPAFPRTDRLMDSYTRREVETVERQGVTRRTLGQLSERPNGGHKLQGSPSDGFLEDERPVTAPSASTQCSNTRRRSLISNQENVPINGTSTTTYKGNQVETVTDRTAQAVMFKQPQRPGLTRQDSIKLLQRLARVSSLSPSPAKPSPDDFDRDPAASTRSQAAESAELSGSHEKHEGDADSDLPLSAIPANSDYIADVEPSGARSRSSSSRRTLRRRLHVDRNDVGTAPLQAEVKASEALASEESNGFHAADQVKGLDKKLEHATDVRPLLRTSDTTILRAFGTPSGEAMLSHVKGQDKLAVECVRQVPGGSKRPTSALDDIVREAREHPDGQFGEATIQSLEDIAHPNMDATDTTLTVDVGSAADAEDGIDTGRSLTQAERDRRQEDLAMEAMNRHLRAARTSIKDADRGLRRVEHRVEETAHGPMLSTGSNRSVESTTVYAKPGAQTTHQPCPHCKNRYSSIRQALFGEFLSSFYVSSPVSRLGIRLTALGQLVLLSLLYYLVEQTLCYFYCQPMYAYTMRGYGVNPDAPRYPFVIPTLLFRPLRPVWRPALNLARESLEASWYWVAGIEQQKLPISRFGQPGFRLTPEMMRPDLRFGVAGVGDRSGSLKSAGLGTAAAAGAGVAAAKWGGWAGTTMAKAAVTSTMRVVSSAAQAVDDVGRMWEDEWLE